MATETSSIAREPSFFLTLETENKTSCSEINSLLDKLTKAVQNHVELRAAIYLQTEEKIQQYHQAQLLKLKNEEHQYIDKCKELEKSMSDCKTQIKEIEYSYCEQKEKLSAERDLNVQLKDEISNLKTEKDNMNAKFQYTLTLYSTVIRWYEDYLKIYIDIDQENNIMTLYFNIKKYSTTPYVKFEVLGDSNQKGKFKLLEAHSFVQYDKENLKEFYSTREMISFIYYTRERLLALRKSFRNMPEFEAATGPEV